jgi:integrase
MLDFRAWWLERIRAGVTPNSANKDIIHLSDILRTVNRMKRLGLSLPLEGMTLKQGTKNQRKAFSEKWIREQLLRPGAMAGLNTEARCIVLGMVNTGYRPSEGAALLPQHIILDVEYPHIKIEAVGRVLKSQYAERTIPLAGISLEALRECRDGFPRYRDNAGLSDTVNKFLRENKLLESDEHTLYGLRHSFEDRLLDRDTDDRIRRDLMGHALDRQRYGEGASLEKLSRIVQAIAL